MRLERLKRFEGDVFERAYDLYKSSFPVEERRDDEEQRRVLKNEAYHFDVIKENDEFIGIMLYWEVNELVYLEHFAIRRDLREKGYGTAVLNLLKENGKTILLEIEPPVDDITVRRYEFYKRNGFVMNPFYHIQAKYHLGDADLELKILSYPRELEKDEYLAFYEYMTREIGIQPSVSGEVTVRALKDTDDLSQVAKLIYLTDPYIYPGWFDSIDDGIKVIREMIFLPTLYNLENITVAVLPDGFIAGMVVSKQAPFVEELKYVCKAFELAGVPMDNRTAEMFDAYYAKMGQAEDGFYIANVAVDEKCRKRGIAASLVEHVLTGHDYCSLECVVANVGTLRLHQRIGFRIAYEYPGVFGVPCYKMFYKA